MKSVHKLEKCKKKKSYAHITSNNEIIKLDGENIKIIVNKAEKRHRNQLSPETSAEHNKKIKTIMSSGLDTDQPVGNLPMKTLLSAFESLLKSSLEELSSELRKATEEVQLLKKENVELKNLVNELRQNQKEVEKRVELLDGIARQNKLIIRGIRANIDPKEEVKKLCKETLLIQNDINIRYVKKLYEADGKMNIVVDFQDATIVSEILMATRNLAGTYISINRDLTKEAQQRRGAMVQLRKAIIEQDKSKMVKVRGDQLIIQNLRFTWKSEVLMCGNQNGINELKKLYNRDLEAINVNYRELLDLYNRSKRSNNNFSKNM